MHHHSNQFLLTILFTNNYNNLGLSNLGAQIRNKMQPIEENLKPGLNSIFVSQSYHWKIHSTPEKANSNQ